MKMPAIPYIQLVKNYAIARGLNFFTWKEMEIAFRLYNAHASINN
jgi:hypothetical protein